MLDILGQTDIYLIDQIMRGNLKPGMTVLDAGFGGGRNSELPVRLGCHVKGIDLSREAIDHIRVVGADWGDTFQPGDFIAGDLTDLPYHDASFEFVICSAVLHFAENQGHFTRMFTELIRVLKPGGSLWFRMTTKHTLAHLSRHLSDDVYEIPDGSIRYLLDRAYLEQLMKEYRLEYADPFKTVNVDDIRTMCVVTLRKGL